MLSFENLKISSSEYFPHEMFLKAPNGMPRNVFMLSNKQKIVCNFSYGESSKGVIDSKVTRNFAKIGSRIGKWRMLIL